MTAVVAGRARRLRIVRLLINAKRRFFNVSGASRLDKLAGRHAALIDGPCEPPRYAIRHPKCAAVDVEAYPSETGI